MKALISGGILAVFGAICLSVLVWHGRFSVRSEPKLTTLGIQATPVPTPVPTPQSQLEIIEPSDQAPDLALEHLEPLLVDPLEVQGGVLPWEERIHSVLRATHLSDSSKARILLSGLNGLPEEGLQSASREAIDRLPDKDYAIAALVLINPKTHGMVQSVLFADLLERPDLITLPTLLAIARNSNHPLAGVARENLELLLGQNFGNHWPQWEVEISRVLQR